LTPNSTDLAFYDNIYQYGLIFSANFVTIWPNWSEFGIDFLDSIPTIAENRPNQTNLAVFTPLGAYWAN
jgi:hypothetical protein